MAETISAAGSVIPVCYQGRNKRISKATDLTGSTVIFIAV